MQQLRPGQPNKQNQEIKKGTDSKVYIERQRPRISDTVLNENKVTGERLSNFKILYVCAC